MGLTKRHILNSVLFSGALMVSGLAQASYVSEAEPNDSIATAQNLNPYFSTDLDANIEDSTNKAHASVHGTGNGTWDYYSFSIASPADVLFDIDYAQPDLDSWLNIFDSAGVNIAHNDDGNLLDPGSVHPYDSRLPLYLESGLYYVAVGAFPGVPVPAPQSDQVIDYTLHVSTVLFTPPVTTPLPAAAPLMLSGLGAIGVFMRRRKSELISA